MNAKEIREQPDLILDAINKHLEVSGVTKEEGLSLVEKGLKTSHLWALSEIAAQLAETNEKLNIILNPPLMYDTSKIDTVEISELPNPIMNVMQPRATLRDQFAMAALTGMLAGNNGSLDIKGDPDWAYKYADSMLEARK
jgi:hypothetical protein